MENLLGKNSKLLGKIICIPVFVLLCFIGRTVQSDTSFEGKNILLKFSQEGNIIAPTGIIDKRSKYNFSAAEISPFWRLQLKNSKGEIWNVSPFNLRCEDTKVEIKGESIEILWKGIKDGNNVSQFNFEIKGELQDEDLVYWRCHYLPLTNDNTLRELVFPILLIRADDGSNFVHPCIGGQLYSNPLQNEDFISLSSRHKSFFEYPGGYGIPMQFMSLYTKENGFFFSSFDGEGYHKIISVRPVRDESLEFSIVHYPPNMIDAGKEYLLPYPVVTGVYKGNWYNAARIYRKWATRQIWCSKGPMSKRKDIPEWFKECFWIRGWLDEKVALSLGKIFQPIAMHCYGWDDQNYAQNRFGKTPEVHNPSLPDLAPKGKGSYPGSFEEYIELLHSQDIKIMPYLNARLYEIFFPSWQEAKKYGLKDEKGENRLEGDAGRTVGVMCPYTSWWQNKIKESCIFLAKDFKVDGIYLDQLIGGEPNLCFDKTHGHPPGGGNFWLKGYRKMLEEIRREAKSLNPEIVMTSEQRSEAWIDLLDGNLGYSWVDNNIPLYSAVYGDYTIIWGDAILAEEIKDRTLTFFRLGESFTFGKSLVRGKDPHFLTAVLLPENKDLLNFLVQLHSYRKAGKEFLVEGELLPPLEIICEPSKIQIKGKTIYKNIKDKEISPVLSSAWKSPNGRIGIFLLNISPETVDFKFSFQPSIEGKKFSLWRWELTRKEKIKEFQDVLREEGKLRTGECLLLVIEE